MAEENSDLDPTQHLPLSLLESEILPPAPSRSAAVDFLLDFAGYSWLAYGASSLLVISHFPSPLSKHESLIGPVLRQVFELSGDESSAVTAVSWSPVTPSIGEVAAACENCVLLYSHDSASSRGSFCWSQNTVLVHNTKVEAIKWTGSGDGIVSGGTEVVLWRRRNRSWEIAWKVIMDQPQTLLSATWSIGGPSASASYPGSCRSEELSKCVSVYHRDGDVEYEKYELHHPQPVTMVQWRQSVRQQLDSDEKYFRNVLLTCCLDGTARLWCEVYNGRRGKVDKDGNNNKKVRKTFSVAAVVEINQSLNGTLGSNLFLTWATEVRGIFKMSDGSNKMFSSEKHEQDCVGACEWLVGFGPGSWVTFWSVHCLDDISPMRFPRVILWKKQELRVEHIQPTSSDSKGHLILDKVFLSRKFFSGPPAVCSLIHYLPCNSVVCSMLQTQLSSNVDESSINLSNVEKPFSCYASGAFKFYGHMEKVLQVSIHPHSHETEISASLGSDGSLLFWSLSTIGSSNAVTTLLNPSWTFCGKLDIQNSFLKYTSIRWAPSVLNEDRVIFLGHAKGIDCFVVKFSQSKEVNIASHYLYTIPVTGHDPYEEGPTGIYTIPLASTCNKTFKYNKFLLLAIWIKGFRALSWEITLHSFDSAGSCTRCNFSNAALAECSMYSFDSVFGGRKYCLNVVPCSACIPDPYACHDVTSFAAVCPSNLSFTQQTCSFTSDSCCNYPPYVMATGCSDGSLKLWRSKMAKLETPYMPWELVGTLAAHCGPIIAISLTDCGQKIASVGKDSRLDSVFSLKIWNSLYIMGGGNYVLEDTISLPGDFVALKWLTIGNGQFLLAVCMQNELQIYARRRSEILALSKPEKPLIPHGWESIAFAHTFPPIHDFVWGPRATGVVIHQRYFSLFKHSLFLVDKNKMSRSHLRYTQDNFSSYTEEMYKNIGAAIFTDNLIGSSREALLDDTRGSCRSIKEISANQNCIHNSFEVAVACLKDTFIAKLGPWSMLKVVEKLGGSVPVYHPQALLLNICSGNWKRAVMSVRHLTECLNTNGSHEKKDGFGKTSYTIPQILLSKYLGLVMEHSTYKEFQWSISSNLDSANSADMLMASSTQPEFGDFVQLLEKHYELEAINATEKLQILAIIDLLREVGNQHTVCAYASLDEPGRRFWVALRFQQLYFFRNFGRKPALEELVLESRLVGWAFHSDCQEVLLGSLLPGDPSWKQMQSLGVGYWFTNATELRTRMEKLARSQYLKKRDPKDCALLYIALNRIQVLAGLFKISKEEKDKPLVGFLSRNFQEEKNKAAALKNAYVLLGKHQLELAVAFFILGDDTTSAVTVCAKNLGDEQLALVICRLIEGDGGELQRYLVTKVILPSAVEKGDYWLASLLEWQLGNCCRSFVNMLGLNEVSVVDKSAISLKHEAFMDPNIGLYCLTLATKSRMKNAVGEQNAAVLHSWATYMTATSLMRCGLPLEALEYFTPSLSGPGILDQYHASDDIHSEVLPKILKCSSGYSSNWLLSDVAILLESFAKSDLVLHYVSKLIKEHPNWSENIMETLEGTANSEGDQICPYNTLLENFRNKLNTGLAQFEQRFSIDPLYITNMAFLYSCNNGFKFIGFDVLHGFVSQNCSPGKLNSADDYLLSPCRKKLVFEGVKELSYLTSRKKLVFEGVKELSYLTSRFIVASNITCTHQLIAWETRLQWSDHWKYYFQDFLHSCQNLRATMNIFSCSSTEDKISELLNVLVLYEFYVFLSSAWLHKCFKGILLSIQPLLNTSTEGQTPYEVNTVSLKRILCQNKELLSDNEKQGTQEFTGVQHRQDGDIVHSVPEEDRWKTIGACLWQHMLKFLKHKSNVVYNDHDKGHFSSASFSEIGYWESISEELDGRSVVENTRLFPLILLDFLKTTVIHLSSYYIKQLALVLRQKADNRMYIPALLWLQENSQPTELCRHEGNVNMENMDTNDESSILEAIWNISVDPGILKEGLLREGFDWSHCFRHKSCQAWIDFDKNFTREHKAENSSPYEHKNRGNIASMENESPARDKPRNSHSFWQKDTISTDELSPFQKPKEVCKRNGELLEALCTNSIDQHQAALASSRKGIVFFNWENEQPHSNPAAEFIWADAEWPHNGWAGSQSTPIPTCVSPGVGLGSKKGAQLGLGGATIGTGSLSKPLRGFQRGRALVNMGHSGLGASGLGWEVQEDFEELTDPPATVENIATRAFSSHPARSLFLVGSINTHIYLWEFGKDKATATYGVLPAANVPPPYALASISALQFDHCGHRFASAALDGTICTWQLEVGGRSNICPTESSLCFNNYASDVTYVTSSGSIVAASGCSSNGVNVVIWDTLAPPTTSRASIVCHEGGARSISVFDNDLGSGSVSPIIVTGGKDGDIGLHDFRYIATGKTKRHRKTSDHVSKNNVSSVIDMQTGFNSKPGDQDVNGMLWYIPKAHSGSVTKISTIPNTSMFLSGSKDGDVKLWDAKKARLVYHWPKLHDRHTFLQPSTRGYGGVIRAAVTDIQAVSNGFLTCGGDGSVKLIQLKDHKHGCEVL